jgi:hypothetical protein
MTTLIVGITFGLPFAAAVGIHAAAVPALCLWLVVMIAREDWR